MWTRLLIGTEFRERWSRTGKGSEHHAAHWLSLVQGPSSFVGLLCPLLTRLPPLCPLSPLATHPPHPFLCSVSVHTGSLAPSFKSCLPFGVFLGHRFYLHRPDTSLLILKHTIWVPLASQHMPWWGQMFFMFVFHAEQIKEWLIFTPDGLNIYIYI